VKLSAWSEHLRRRGMTLVEVVVGIALLAVLLVLILASFRAHAAQIRSAKQRMEAMRRADELLTVWTTSGGIPVVGEQEEIPETPGWIWRIVKTSGSDDLYQLGAAVIRLEIVATPETIGEFPLAAVELLVPAEGTAAQ
jgi:prepilin-type N-terminal cleavage/methylation domain-containing protein